jgi:hypothetical protein
MPGIPPAPTQTQFEQIAMDADKIRRAHSRFVEGVLKELHTIA